VTTLDVLDGMTSGSDAPSGENGVIVIEFQIRCGSAAHLMSEWYGIASGSAPGVGGESGVRVHTGVEYWLARGCR
jgi:hypothetical protein